MSNLLVTNFTAPVGYGIVRHLRGFFDQIIVTRNANLPPLLGWSRLVDHTCRLSCPKEGWLQGLGEGENTKAEELHVEALLDLCERRDVDVIFPASVDPEIYVLSKNKRSFTDRGITVVVPEFDRLIETTDKYLVTRAAIEMGFPCPRTVLCESRNELAAAAEGLGYPLVLKARFSYGSEGVLLVTDWADLLEKSRRPTFDRRGLILQEYVPGSRERSLNFVIDCHGEVALAFALKKIHYINPSFSTAVEVVESPSEMPKAVSLLQRLGNTGFSAIQTKIDQRDGSYKLIEVNPRFGNNARILFEFGLNLPLLCLETARRKPIATAAYPVGLSGVSPFDDLGALRVHLAHRRLRRRSVTSAESRWNPLPSVRSMLKSYLKVYHRGTVIDYYSRSLFRDPLVTLAYYGWVVLLLRSVPEHFIPWGEIE